MQEICLPPITRVACAGLATGFSPLIPLPLQDGPQEERDNHPYT